MVEIDEALAGSNLVRAAEIGHRMRPAASAVGALSFAALCHRLEGLGEDGGIDLVAQMAALLEHLPHYIAQQLDASGSD